MDRIRKYLKDGVARFSHAQIPDYKTFGVEIIKTSKPIMVELGKNADIIIWDINDPIQIPYKFSINPIKSVIKSGKIIF